jgi:cytochrome d ubiquinol oxidase subunit I
MEEAVLLARLQFAITTVYHFFFVPLTLGLSILVAILQTQWYRTGNPQYRALTKFWGRLFLVNFGIGLVTGIVQEFQFGMNWSAFSAFVGDIFGAPLAIEALLAFFLESTFLGIWIFGEGKISPKLHLTSIWLVAIGSNISAIWILIANSFMQNPVGYVLNNGRAEMNDFFAVITNPHIFLQFPHVFFGGLTAAGFFMLGISAWHLLRRQDSANASIFLKSFRMGAVVGLIGALGVSGTGHPQGQQLAQIQPMKLAAMEGMYETSDPAGLSLFTVINEKTQEESFSIKIPSLVSMLVYNSPTGVVRGMRDIQTEYQAKYGPANYIPSVFLCYWSFRAMVGVGLALIGLGGLAVLLSVVLKRPIPRKLLIILPWAIALPYIGNATGWILTEVGRAPWVVQGLMRLDEGVSPGVPASSVLISLIVFTLVYATLILTTIKLFRHHSKAGITPADLSH